jgi:transcriptional regulator with PAS, ATPase and Fis domain
LPGHETVDAVASTRPSQSGVIVFAVSEGRGAVRVVSRGGSVVIGRDPSCDLPVDDPSVSRTHARLLVGPPLTVVDLGSRNGTRLRGERLDEGCPVLFAPGSLLQLGRVSIVVQCIGDARQTPATSAAVESAGDHELVCAGAVAHLVTVVDRVASDALSILLLGETGTGKDVFAELIHKRSVRAKAPFTRLHCAAMSEALIESEIFGHERGAFTGAERAKPGLLEEADGGTVFIDEIGELPLSVQVKLLRVLEDRRVTRVGGTRPVRLDVRFIAATNRDLDAAMARGTFRRDLYFRLAGLVLALPALRERRDEIRGLASRFLEGAAARRGLGMRTIDDEAMSALLAHDWPGNVRELRNVIERAMLLSDGLIGVEHLRLQAPRVRGDAAVGGGASSLPSTLPPPASVSEEVPRILEALARCGGNQTSAAKLLGISRRTLINRIVEYDLPRPRRA